MQYDGGFKAYRIFIVEDDPVIAEAVRAHLAGWGAQARVVEDFERVLAEFAAFDPQLVLMDIGLPRRNGYYWCARIREVSGVPIIFLSSASDNMNVVTAINMGGDDFIAKPFDLFVLTAKVRAMLRRTYDLSGGASLIECGGAVLNLADNTLMTPGGEKIDLTKNEFRMLQMLMEHKGEIVSRDALMARLWESDAFVDENTLTVNVTRLRKKLEGAGLRDFIKTKKGAGYVVS